MAFYQAFIGRITSPKQPALWQRGGNISAILIDSKICLKILRNCWSSSLPCICLTDSSQQQQPQQQHQQQQRFTDYSYLGLFVPWTIRTMGGLFNNKVAQ